MHLSRESKRLFRELVSEYQIEDAGGLAVLTQACESLDRLRQAQAAIQQDGAVIHDRFGQPRPHPLLVTERDARAAFLMGLKALNLDLEPLRDRYTER